MMYLLMVGQISIAQHAQGMCPEVIDVFVKSNRTD